MSERILPVSKWLLDGRKEVVGFLQRNERGRYVIEEGSRLGIGRFEIIAPEGIGVYRVIKRFSEVKIRNDLLFTYDLGNIGGPVYLSIIDGSCLETLKLGEIELLRCSWFNWDDSSKVFYRLVNTCGRSLFNDTIIQNGNHPFAIKSN